MFRNPRRTRAGVSRPGMLFRQGQAVLVRSRPRHVEIVAFDQAVLNASGRQLGVDLVAVISGPGSCVEVIEADELDVAVCGRGAELGGGLGAAEEEQAGDFRARLSGADQKVPDAAQAGEVPHASLPKAATSIC